MPAIRTSITKSRAGHYTVTLRDDRGRLIYCENLIDNLSQARAIAKREAAAYLATA